MSAPTIVALYPLAALLFAAFLLFVGVVQDVLGFLRERQHLPPVAACSPSNGAEGVPQSTDSELAQILEPFGRRAAFRVVQGGDPGEAA